MIDYSFNNKDVFYTLKKSHRLCLKKTNNNGIQICKKEKKGKEQSFIINNSRLQSNIVNASSVYNNLSKIRLIAFEVTDACNLRCAYCAYREFYDNHDTRKNKNIDVNKAKILIDFLVEKKQTAVNHSLVNEIVVSFYGGEPLLNIDFIKEMV